ncbi:MAG: GGDEF domain-containing protein, partial [Kineosporiaceae bacterium]
LGDGQARQTPIGGADRRTVVAPVQVDGTRGVLVVALDTHDARQRARQLWLLLGVVLLLGALSLAPLVFLGGGRGLIRRYRQALAAGSTDDLTGLGTRRSFRRDLAAEVARASRHGHPLTVALLDVNGLELVNSTVGRRRGDALLAALGVALGTAMRQVPGRRTYRVGGDAFAVVMPGSTVDQAFAVTDDLRATISRTAAPLTANVGLSTLDPERCPDVETLLIAADAALFEARALGGNRVVASGEEGTGLRWVATSGTDSGRG